MNEKKDTNYIQLNEDYRVRSDGKLNLILQEKFEKKESKGKFAKGTGEYDFRDLSYHGNLETLLKSMIRNEQLKTVHEVDSLEKVVSYIREVEKSVIKHISEKVILSRK